MLNYILLDASLTKGMDIKNIVLIVSFVLVFYFFMIRPQQKRQKEQRGFLEQIKRGDNVVTIGGIHARVYEILDNVIVLETDDKGSKIKVAKNAISIDATKRQTPVQK